jgi:uncharacterized damage-inducible protein DinB
MSALRNIRMLARYNTWANALLFDALAKLATDELTVQHGGRSMLSTLGHAWTVDLIWQANLEGRDHGFTSRAPAEMPTFIELTKAQADSDRWYENFTGTLTEAAHDELVDFRFVGGREASMTRGDMLLHVVNHKTYHRGYVAQMLYIAGHKPPTMDLPVFLRDVPHAS